MHAGEYVLTADEARGARGGGVSMGNIVINVSASESPEQVAAKASGMAYRHTLRAMRESKAMRDAVGAGQRGSLHT